jgi:galactoside 2-L-fucosyltransferase 1/2
VWGAPSLASDLYHLSRFKVVGQPDTLHYARYRPDVYVDAPAPNILAQGCLQSWRYLDPVTPIPFRLKAMDAAGEWVAARGLTAAIHVRRGDKVVGDDNNNVPPPLRYYRMAMAELQRQFPSPAAQRYVVVTDDPEWVRAQPFFIAHTHALLSRREDPAFDMAVIARCRHKILSIGTFGWWGAFFTDPGHNRTQAVLYPTPQMRDAAGFGNADYFPPHWTALAHDGTAEAEL